MSRQFSDFYSSLDADPIKRGKQFEHFVKWFLKADPEWATQVDQVWLWDEYPQRWGMDCGIDLVFRHKNGEHWAVQASVIRPTITSPNTMWINSSANPTAKAYITVC